LKSSSTLAFLLEINSLALSVPLKSGSCLVVRLSSASLFLKSSSRSDEDFKNKEADDKRTTRQDPDFRGTERARELISKRNARVDEDFKNKEADDKRTERARELISKRNARVDEDFKNKEADDKRTARQDPYFRGTERARELIS
jgi:hypothetical protein